MSVSLSQLLDTSELEAGQGAGQSRLLATEHRLEYLLSTITSPSWPIYTTPQHTVSLQHGKNSFNFLKIFPRSYVPSPVVSINKVENVGLFLVTARSRFDGDRTFPSPAIHVFMLVHVLVRRPQHRILLLVLEHVLDAGPGPGVHHVVPVLVRVLRQLLPALDYEHAGVADLAVPDARQLEAAHAVILILLTVSEPRTRQKIFIQKYLLKQISIFIYQKYSV